MATKIQVLPKALCDQLAAGEVLERASSAIKELIENSLDANADDIAVEIEEAGRKRLCVSDNGCGMSPEDAKLSVLRHATSKIRSTSDLSAISTMGFRGEALASMAAVSKMTVITQPHDADIGTYLRVEGAEMTDCRETAAPPGTQIALEELFFNTPARLKFLKTPATETRRVYEVIEQFALSCHEVHWKLTVDGRVKCDYPKHRSLRERALAVLGRSLFDHLYDIQFTVLENISVEGLYCAPDFIQSSAGRLYTFVNRRVVQDQTIKTAISKAYKEFLHGKQPCVILFLTVPLDQVDVNVHPTKTEVRFSNPDLIFRAVYRAIRSSLELTPWIKNRTDFNMPDAAFQSPEALAQQNLHLSEVSQEKTNDWSAFENALSAPRPATPELDVFDAPLPETQPAPVFSPQPIQRSVRFSTDTRDSHRTAAPQSPAPPQDEEIGYFSQLKYIGQHDQTYLICADGDDLVIIDQHAAHERINFEILKKTADGILSPTPQGLLFPLLLSLDARLSAVLDEHIRFFEQLGFLIDPMGNLSYAIRATPACMRNYDYIEIIRAALLDIAQLGRTDQFDDIRDNIIATMACHRSIRAGQTLSPDEVKNLLKRMDATGFRSNCPHGRPVYFVLSASELEKRFLRTGFVK